MLDDKRIFLLEDDVNNLAIISSILRRYNAHVFYDTWGVTTVKKIRKFLPLDIILLDLMLPGNVSGFDVFDQIKAFEDMVNIPIVAVTAADPGMEMKKARDKGFNGFLSKPVRARTFVPALKSIMEGETVWGEVDV
jgi:CheY-like chemotaxis protein